MPQICGDAKKSKTYGCVLLVFYWKHAKATLKKQRADTFGCWVCVKLLQPAKKTALLLQIHSGKSKNC